MSANGAACGDCDRKRWYDCASACSASADLADSVNTCGLLSDSALCATCGCGGADWSITWAFVPPIPKALTPASNGSSGAGHGPSSVCTRIGSSANGILGLGC